MTVKNLELETVCGITSTLPQHTVLEIAFWGRSNVGKSSLLNTLWGRKNFARISSEPGKTQTINYYRVNDIYMVDLPGYGYAKTSRETSAKWMKMIENYLMHSQALRVIFLLIDSRHKPTEKDMETVRLLLTSGFNPLIVATKIDKLKKNDRNRNLRTIKETIANIVSSELDGSDDLPDIPVIPFSSSTGEGRDEMWEYIEYFSREIQIQEGD